MKKYRILVVDDDYYTLMSIKKDFKSKGYEIITVDNGEEAVELLKKTSFDLVISDLLMEGINGIQVLKKSKEINPETMVIIITGYGDMDSAIEAIRSGVDDYIPKPCQPEDLHFHVRRCLEKMKARKKQKAAEDALREREKIQSILEMAGAICHELNQPLQVITGYADLLLMNISKNNSEHRKIKAIQEQIDRIGMITKKLMNITSYRTKDYIKGKKIFDIDNASI